MVAARNAALVGLMLLLVSAVLSPQTASAREVAPDLPEIDFGQPLSDSVLKELCGKASLVGFGNDLTGVVVVQVNSGSGNQVSTASVFSTQTTLKGPGTNIISLDANTAKQFRTIIGFFKR